MLPDEGGKQPSLSAESVEHGVHQWPRYQVWHEAVVTVPGEQMAWKADAAL